MLGRKELYDSVEGGLNTSILMTACWDHLFPDKRAQGWEKRVEDSQEMWEGWCT